MLTTLERIALIKNRLEQAFQPTRLEIIDESHLHRGHAGAKDGRGHFAVEIHSARFKGVGLAKQHQMVYEVLDDLLSTDIHALKIRTRASD